MKSMQCLIALLSGPTICAYASATYEQCAFAQQHILSDQTPICLDDSSQKKLVTAKLFNHPTWSYKPFCVSKKGKKYCTYTTSNFRTSHGLSIISTPTAADAISSAFPFTESARHISEKHLRVQSIAGKGFGLVTTQSIPKGATILLDTPRIIASAQFPEHVNQSQGASLFNHALEQLLDADRELVQRLDKSLGGTDIEDIMKTNAFACQLHDGGEDDAYMCLFPSVARINHACRPNAHARFIPKTLLMEVKALNEIRPGEEISISYGRIDLRHQERQRLYTRGWNFTCTCSLCTSSPYTITGSDQRRARLVQLRSKLENLTPETYDAQQIVAWEKEVIEISKKEGLEVLLASDYERLAYVYAGLGMLGEAKAWAEKASGSLRDWTVVEGGDMREIERVQKLIGELGG
jgi:hypothetical protein